MTKAQQPMLVAVLEDMTASVEIIVFPKSYADLQSAFEPDGIVAVKGRVRFRERRGAVIGEEGTLEPAVAAGEVIPIKQAVPAGDRTAWHVVAERKEQIDALARLLASAPGPVPIVVHHGGVHRQMSAGIANSVYARGALESIFSAGGVREEPFQHW